MRRALIVGILLLSVPILRAEEAVNPQEMFDKANQAFEKGDLEPALEAYQSLVRRGFGSAELYYNMGNIFYRRGERGKAVLWYERALRMAPRDADIQFNLSLARSHIKEEGDNFMKKIVLYLTDNELAWALALFLWLFFGVLGWRIMRRLEDQGWTGVALWMSGIFLVVITSWFTVHVAVAGEPQAIVTAPPGEVRNGPGDEYAVGFTIPEGSKVLLLNSRPGWTQVGVPQQGLRGWMPSGEVEPVNPPASSN